MPECLNRTSMKGLDIGFPLKLVPESFYRVTCGNDSFMLNISIYITKIIVVFIMASPLDYSN